MPFKKNDSRINREGRPKGAPNKSTDELRTMFRDFLTTNMSKLQADFDQLEPKDRLQFIDRVARLVLPPPVQDNPSAPEKEKSFYDFAREKLKDLK